MKFPPIYQKSPQILQSIYHLDVLKAAFEMYTITDEQAHALRRVSLLKSGLFSARIEGNILTEDDLAFGIRGREKEKMEIEHLVQGYEYIDLHTPNEVSGSILQALHSIIGADVLSEYGHFRTEDSAIFDASGTAVYLTPAPVNIHALLEEWYTYVNTSTDDPRIVSAVSHIWFEKIHPFLDGNGRLGRLVSYYILKKHGYDFGGFVPIEEYIDTHKSEYYYSIGRDTQDVTIFVEYYLTALHMQATKTIYELQHPRIENTHRLSPRRNELYMLIREQKMMTFDSIRRRFLGVALRTLHYDLSELQKKGLIKKLGSTRGAVYTSE
mgnify:CR=1 FL=1